MVNRLMHLPIIGRATRCAAALIATFGLMACDESTSVILREEHSLLTFNAHPRAYDGEPVAVFGFVRLWPSVRSDVIYANCDDALNQNELHLVRLYIDNDHLTDAQRQALDGRYVAITGTYVFPLLVDNIETIEPVDDENVLRPSCFEAIRPRPTFP